MILPDYNDQQAVVAFMNCYYAQAKVLAIEWLHEAALLNKDSVADLVGEKMGFDWELVRGQEEEYRKFRASVWCYYCSHRRTLLEEIKLAKQRLKRRYNLCARLRAKGVAIITDSHAIDISLKQYEALPSGAMRYLEELRNQYQYSVQLRIQEEV